MEKSFFYFCEKRLPSKLKVHLFLPYATITLKEQICTTGHSVFFLLWTVTVICIFIVESTVDVLVSLAELEAAPCVIFFFKELPRLLVLGTFRMRVRCGRYV
jgi:hypothetical protein